MCPDIGYYTFDYIRINRKSNLCFVVQNLQARLPKSECVNWKKGTRRVQETQTCSPLFKFSIQANLSHKSNAETFSGGTRW